MTPTMSAAVLAVIAAIGAAALGLLRRYSMLEVLALALIVGLAVWLIATVWGVPGT